MSPQTNFVTEEGLRGLKSELEELKKKRTEIASAIEEARPLGDLSENASYDNAREAQAFNEGRIAELEELVRTASIISKLTTETVELGATIDVEGSAGTRTFTIVGSEEADPATGRISNESPLGRVFLGRRKGDTVEAKTPKGMAQYKITAIR